MARLATPGSREALALLLRLYTLVCCVGVLWCVVQLFVEFLVAYCMATPTEVLKVLFKAFRDADGGLRAMGT